MGNDRQKEKEKFSKAITRHAPGYAGHVKMNRLALRLYEGYG